MTRHRSMPHLQRKLYHCLMGLICFGLYGFVLDRVGALWALFTVGGAWVMLDLLRLRFAGLNRAALKVFGSLMRKTEMHGVSANSYYIAGMIFVTLFFPKEIALLAVLFLAVGDPVAGAVGTAVGRTRLWGNKTLEGSLANFVVSATASFLFANFYLNLSPELVFLVAASGGLISAFAELVPSPVDDNLTVPAVSALLLYPLFLAAIL